MQHCDMKKLVLLYCMLFTLSGLNAQSVYPRYREYADLVKRADSLYKAGAYDASATCYNRAIGVRVEKGIPVSYADLHYSAACCWALAGLGDSAFVHLQAMAALGYSDPVSLGKDQDLASLHGDARWSGLINKVASALVRKELLKKTYEERTRFTGKEDETVFLPLHDNVKRLIQCDSLPFISLNYKNFRLFFRGNAYAAGHLPELKQQVSDAFAAVLAKLDANAYATGINLVLVDSRDELKEVTGIRALGGLALVGDNTVFLVFNGKRRLQAKHELFHLLSNDVWGNTFSRLLDEGGAVFADNECYAEDPIYGISAWFMASGKLLPFTALINDFDREAGKSDVIAYLESAAIFKYLYEKYGIPKLKRLRTEGFEKFKEIYGFSLFRLEKEWNEMINGVNIPKDIDWNKLLEEGCG